MLIPFNLVLAVAVIPTARACARSDPRRLGAAGIAVFAAASAACAVAPSQVVLIAARCVQAVGGAVALMACLELLVAINGDQRGTRAWIVAGVVGTALRPVVGGVLTQAFAWQAIFIVQVPVAILAAPAAFSAHRGLPTVTRSERHPPAVRPNVALMLVSAALTAALFLLVLLLVDGWRQSPATAAATVTVVPVAAFLASPLTRRWPAGPTTQPATGCALIVGGLIGLAALPSAHLG